MVTYHYYSCMLLSASSALHWLFMFKNTHYSEEEEKEKEEEEEDTESQDKEREEGKNEMVCEGICLL